MPIVLWVLRTVAGWLRALPAPTEHWAAMISALGWPTAILAVAYLLRGPLRVAANHLARRMEKDRIKVAGFLEIDAATSVIDLDQSARHVKIIEDMWEFVGASDENWESVVSWISRNVGPSLEMEDFLSETAFASLREKAYMEMIEG